jgi:primosomal protein N'
MGEHERFVCPQHPDIEQDAPGECPKCGSELVAASTIGTPAPAPPRPHPSAS